MQRTLHKSIEQRSSVLSRIKSCMQLTNNLVMEDVIQLLYCIFSNQTSKESDFAFHIDLHLPFLWITDGCRMKKNYKYQGYRFDMKQHEGKCCGFLNSLLYSLTVEGYHLCSLWIHTNKNQHFQRLPVIAIQVSNSIHHRNNIFIFRSSSFITSDEKAEVWVNLQWCWRNHHNACVFEKGGWHLGSDAPH